MIYTIEIFKMFTSCDISDIVYATIDKEDAMKYFERQCKSAEKEKYFVEYNMYEWTKPDLKCLLDTWNNGYKRKE